MKAWRFIAVSLVITLAIGGIYLLSVFKHRQNPGVIGQQDTSQNPTMDDVAVVRLEFPQHFEDVLNLQGKSVWMKNGYTMPYFAYTGGKVDFAKRIGLIPAAQRLDVKKVIKASVPAKVDDGIEHGTKQAIAVFALPGQEDLLATPIGVMDGNEERYYSDILFFYDDPHTIYNNWSKDMWAAIDAHQVKSGMNELQTRLAIGQKMHPDGQKEGDRTVTYDQDGKHWTVTFVKNSATAIKSA